MRHFADFKVAKTLPKDFSRICGAVLERRKTAKNVEVALEKYFQADHYIRFFILWW